MLKRPIKYEDFDGDEQEDIFYFNISKAELIEMDVEHDQGMQKVLQRLIDTKDKKGIVEQMKSLVLMAYGVKSEDNKRFIKTAELREQFTQMPAYSALFMELATDESKAAEFLIGCLPNSLTEGLEKAEKERLAALAKTS